MSQKSRFFSVMVVGENPQSITEKYSIDHKCEPYVKYKYLDAKKYQTAAIKALAKLLDESDKIGMTDNIVAQLRERLKALEKMSSFEYYRELTDGLYYDQDGNAISDENKDTKFNTCRNGGNFSMPLILKDGTESYSAYAKDIDWDAMHGAKAELYKATWELVIEGREPTTDDEKAIYEAMKDKTAYLEGFGTKEDYIIYSTSYWNYGYVDKNGWKDIDDYGNSIEWVKNFYNTFVKSLNPNDLVTICECSIYIDE